MLKELSYRLLGGTAGSCFNVLNILLKGNLPPFGSVCVVVEENERYLQLMEFDGKNSLPGGFMRWREDPLETAQRECEEETGLRVSIQDMIGCFSCPSDSFKRMSTLTLVYSAHPIGGQLRQGVEGRPIWSSETETLRSLELRSRRFFESYLRFYRRLPGSEKEIKAALPVPISERL